MFLKLDIFHMNMYLSKNDSKNFLDKIHIDPISNMPHYLFRLKFVLLCFALMIKMNGLNLLPNSVD
jgi:hypothetical protein